MINPVLIQASNQNGQCSNITLNDYCGGLDSNEKVSILFNDKKNLIVNEANDGNDEVYDSACSKLFSAAHGKSLSDDQIELIEDISLNTSTVSESEMNNNFIMKNDANIDDNEDFIFSKSPSGLLIAQSTDIEDVFLHHNDSSHLALTKRVKNSFLNQQSSNQSSEENKYENNEKIKAVLSESIVTAQQNVCSSRGKSLKFAKINNQNEQDNIVNKNKSDKNCSLKTLPSLKDALTVDDNQPSDKSATSSSGCGNIKANFSTSKLLLPATWEKTIHLTRAKNSYLGK